FSQHGYKFWNNGHESPNAGQPITAMALTLDCSLGGPTSYDGKLKEKPYFGMGTKVIEVKHLQAALDFTKRFDLIIILILISLIFTQGTL
ncbi:MAG: cobalamin biosynthesis protein, partial [Thiovulaceae bacterium]|nr:cobalamin biosynthesis protein [Sulfurimonadaceae bacterium]